MRIEPTNLSLGLDIGSNLAKLIVARNLAGQIAIQRAGAVRIPLGMVEGGVIRHPRGFGKLLGKWVRTFGVSGTPTVFSIPSDMAALRWIALPPLEGEERRNAARIKVRRHLPFSVERAYIEATQPEAPAPGNLGQSLVVAVRKDVVDSRAEAVHHAGLTPVAAELEAQAVLRVVERRLLERSAMWRHASLTIIDVGGHQTQMYVVQNQSLQFIRSVRFGGDLLAAAVAKALGLALADAAEVLAAPTTYLRADGFLVAEWEESTAVVSVSGELDKLVREFLRLLRYFRSLHPERSYSGILDHMVLSGGLAGLSGFLEYLGANLGLRIETASPFAGLLAEVDQDGFQEVSQRQETYTVAVGLALSGMERKHELAPGGELEREFEWQRAA
ncbi:MAG TPA: type IV pilus assembly protein PilM [Fimbriimonadaceae bacterium]|nr:type IV pilus assembly protein PilM [Fimbriimonadaceae bacterium]